jgi:ABC-type Mn2+/Zn2+ transport system permease subunit/Mn-dependent DtxR family transcriptional regulator/Fe2+ transport system protein FeoA
VSELYRLFLEPLVDYSFMRYGVAMATIVGLTSAVLSCLLVVRRQALLGDAISHAVLLGVALGWVVAGHVGVLLGALVAGVLTGVGIAFVERNSRVKLDAAMGVLFTCAFALGLAVISVLKPRGIDLFHVLLGNVLAVGPNDLWLTGTSGGLVVIAVLALFKELHLWSFDPQMAKVVGMPTGILHYLFMALLSATIVASLQAVGLVLVIAMLITPGATAYLVADRLATMMWAAAVVGLVSAVGGLYASFYFDVASGPAMAIVASGFFLVAFLFAPSRGLVTRRLLRYRAVRRAAEEDVLKAVLKAEREEQIPLTAADLAARGGPATAPATRRLVRRGLLTAQDGTLRVSARGMAEGLRMVRTHRLLERYLYDAERVPFEDLHAQAERMEHQVAPEVLDDIDRSLGRPPVDPHGHTIPRAVGDLARLVGLPLAEAGPGRPYRVEMVRDDREESLRRMVSLGILPHEIVTVLGSSQLGPRVRIGEREVAIPADIAQRVFVVPLRAPVDGEGHRPEIDEGQNVPRCPDHERP